MDKERGLLCLLNFVKNRLDIYSVGCAAKGYYREECTALKARCTTIVRVETSALDHNCFFSRCG